MFERESVPFALIASDPNDSVLMFGDDARQQADEADEVAVDRRQIGELARGDVAADFLRRDVDDRRLGADVHHFLDRPHFQRQIERRRLADLELDGLLHRLEARERGGHFIWPRHDAADEVASRLR